MVQAISFEPALSPHEQRLLLAKAAQWLASAGDFDDILRQTIGACLPGLGDFGFFDALAPSGDEVRRTVAAHEAPDIEALLASTRWVRQVHPELNLCALTTGEAALHPQIDEAFYDRMTTDPEARARMRVLGFRSMITVPMRWRGEVLGSLTLFMARSGRRHTDSHLAFAAELADLAAPLVANARLLDRHRRAEAQLRIGEERLRLAIDAGQVGIWDWDIRSGELSWSDRVYAMQGLVPGSEPPSLALWERLVVPEDMPRVQAALDHALREGAAYAIEYRTQLPDGGVRWLSTRGHLVRDAKGEVLRMVGAVTDVTERVELLAAERRARGEAEAARRRMELLASAGELLANSLDPQETLETIARTIVPGITDWCRIDLLDDQGKLHRALAYHSDPARAADALDVARRLNRFPDSIGSMSWVIRTGQSFTGDFSLPREDMDPTVRDYTARFGMHQHFTLPLVARGRTIGAMAVVQAESGRPIDEGDRALVLELARRAAIALDNARLFAEAAAARQQAELANRAKDEFLAMLGHELRNPLAPIANTLELMARRDDHAFPRERQVIGRQVKHLSRLIDDLLDISRITRGKVELRREPVDLKAVLGQALELTQPLYAGRASAPQVRLSAGRPRVLGDPVRLAQVVSNLLVNAAKFTPPEGAVELHLREEPGWAEIQVRDTGCGIGPDLLPRVFEMFVQGGQASDRRAGGLGLGLAIVRSLAEMHGGTVLAHSDGEGHGATFTVRLPTMQSTSATSAPAASPQPSSATPGSGRVLVVDDNADAADTLAELLQLLGYETTTAGDADAALKKIDEFRPQLALFDIGLPGTDGYELARQVRARPDGASYRLVALTGYGQESDRARAMEAKFDEHLVKPVAIDDLTSVISRLLG